MKAMPQTSAGPGSRTGSADLRDGNVASEWDEYVGGHRHASLYHHAAWHDVVRQAFGKDTHYLYARNESGRLCGVLPLVRQKSLLFGDKLVSIPYCNFGGALADDAATEAALRKAAIELGAALGCDSIALRNSHAAPLQSPWQPGQNKVRMVLELPPSVAELDKALGSKRRSQINRSRREGATVEIGGESLLPEFYEVFAENMRDLGTPVYPPHFFSNVASACSDNVTLIVVRIGTETVASGFLMRYRDAIEIPWAAARRKYAKIAVNMLLYWSALAYSVEEGCSSFDFGRCTPEEGTYRFKKQWGSREHPLYWSSWYADPVGASDQPSASAELMRRVWMKMPLPLANRLGPMITSNLPW